MAHEARTPRGPSGQRRSHGGRLAAAAIGVATTASLGLGLNHVDKPTTPIVSEARVLPDSSLTPGVIDPAVHGTEICEHNWKPGPAGSPPVQGGTQTYSQPARHTSQTVKEQAFAEYDIENPHDGGHGYEIDHRIPLSLGGRDVLQNLWPQSRTASGYNAWVKDRLEYRLYNLVCPKTGESQVTLAEAQNALKGDWTKAYEIYCSNEDDCPAYGDTNE